MSSYDIVGMNENSYHMLLLGFMCSVGERYQVYRNHESGAGRPDLILRPSEQIYPSYILELKNCRGRNPETVLKEALQQIEERKYATELLGELLVHDQKVMCQPLTSWGFCKGNCAASVKQPGGLICGSQASCGQFFPVKTLPPAL
ncbi:MAG TPA: PD-(D/E)XK nuclease domain-containing protein [Candidatus Avisuccinivibrio pullicola]|nr:PD-(D/E)XK nuclease domain-containing protein [Candidatus Avisuccinivibrio pullicola]